MVPDPAPFRRRADGEPTDPGDVDSSLAGAARQLATELADVFDDLARRAGELQTSAAASAQQIASDAADFHQLACNRAERAAKFSKQVLLDLHAPGELPGLTRPDAMQLVQGIERVVAEAKDASGLAATVSEIGAQMAETAARLELEILATVSAARDLAGSKGARPGST